MIERLFALEASALRFLDQVESRYTDLSAKIQAQVDQDYERALAVYRESIKELDQQTQLQIARPYKPSSYLSERVFLRDQLQDSEKRIIAQLRVDLKGVLLEIATVLKSSPILTETDLRDLSVYSKTLLAAVRFNRYEFWESKPIYGEHGNILFVEPSGQKETIVEVKEVRSSLIYAIGKVSELLEFQDHENISALNRSGDAKQMPADTVPRYRSDTAFVMMQIAKDNPSDEDTINKIVAVFKRFGIKALRADQIIHDGPITERIIQEITTSEFLFADLTGERPSVYYEVGFAHALGKRVMLCRKEGSKIHFDLANHNCPEYRNLTDLERQLTNKLLARDLIQREE